MNTGKDDLLDYREKGFLQLLGPNLLTLAGQRS